MLMMPRGFEISSIKLNFRYIKFDINEVVYYGSKWEFGRTNNILMHVNEMLERV